MKFLLLSLLSAFIPSFYPSCGVVTEINRTEDYVVYEEFNGNLFSFYGAEDYEVGDIVATIMSDKGTECVYDDEVISARYCGYTAEGR